MNPFEALLEPLAPLSDIGRSGVVRAVGEPQRDVATMQSSSNRNAFLHMTDRKLSHLRIWIAERPELVDLILKYVGIDRPWPHVVALGELCDDPGTLDTVRQIP